MFWRCPSLPFSIRLYPDCVSRTSCSVCKDILPREPRPTRPTFFSGLPCALHPAANCHHHILLVVMKGGTCIAGSSGAARPAIDRRAPGAAWAPTSGRCTPCLAACRMVSKPSPGHAPVLHRRGLRPAITPTFPLYKQTLTSQSCGVNPCFSFQSVCI